MTPIDRRRILAKALGGECDFLRAGENGFTSSELQGGDWYGVLYVGDDAAHTTAFFRTRREAEAALDGWMRPRAQKFFEELGRALEDAGT